ncbi:MAG: dynamin family protein [Micromonosporaceae bacterium]|nr:dynamin family protein [Micromonosporaceae bacterium]
MTEPEAVASTRLARAIEVVESGIQACQAYGRPDLKARLTTARRSLADPAVHIVVAGEFKQGKSSLVNALVGATVCPVDDDVATAVPTYVRHGAEPSANLLLEGDPPGRESVPMDGFREYAIETGPRVSPSGTPVVGVEVRLPRKLLANGLVLVDTPGVGGLGSLHAAASLAAIAMANAVVFVTDASQELTASEIEFLRQARSLCPTVICVLTKIDFYPAWRKIRDLDAGHLARVGDIDIVAVSSSLRAQAARLNDAALNTESGFPSLVRWITERVGRGAADQVAANAAGDVIDACDQISAQFTAEREALSDPKAAQRVLDDLNAAKARLDGLRAATAKWSQTLTDGVADLNSDIDHDLKARIRQILQEADDAIEQSDPADTWPQMEAWLRSRTSYEVLANYTLLRQRAERLSEEVAAHFREASGQVLDELSVFNPVALVSDQRIDHKIEMERMTVGKQAWVALKSAYGGILMFSMLGALTGISLGPIAFGIGLVMGHKGLRDEKKRQLQMRQQQARNAVRRYCDEVTFVMNKDSRDTLRRIQRELRDYYAGLAEELARSNAEALNAANEAVRRTQAERQARLKDIDAELARLRQLRARAAAVRK